MSEDADASEESASEDEAARGPSLVLLDPEVDPELLRALESELGHRIRVAAPLPLEPELPGEDDLAIVVPLDLGSVSGIDLIEILRLRADEGLPIAIASAEPTRRRLRAALRAGATTWLQQPYDPEEWKQRLGPGLAAAAHSVTASAGAEDSEADAESGEAEEASP